MNSNNRPQYAKNFVERFHERFPDLVLLSEYKNNHTHVMVCTKYGVCRIKPNDLMNGHSPTIVSAIDKKSYFANMAREVHGNKYDYTLVEYKNSSKKIDIVCKEHGAFEQAAGNHLNGDGCPRCRGYSREDFIRKSIVTHGDFYDYSLVKYINAKTKVDIICPIHGVFSQLPSAHIRGKRCYTCAIEVSGHTKETFVNKFKGRECMAYIIKCYGNGEEFYKIGITSRSLGERFCSGAMPYEYEPINVIRGSSKFVWNLETALHKKNRKYKYKPKLHFGGAGECFTKVQCEKSHKAIDFKTL
jgi:hypothetical protein